MICRFHLLVSSSVCVCWCPVCSAEVLMACVLLGKIKHGADNDATDEPGQGFFNRVNK